MNLIEKTHSGDNLQDMSVFSNFFYVKICNLIK